MYRILLTGALLAVTPVLSAAESSSDVDRNQITVSGISAGAQMAHQLHIAYPDIFSGAGLIAGGPFGCANGSLSTALSSCMGSVKEEPPLADYVSQIKSAAEQGRLGDTTALSDDRVWVFHGTEDSKVAAALSDATVALYAEFINPENIQFVNDIEAGHNFPTTGNGTECDATESPYIGNCNYDAAGKLLQQLYGKLEPRQTELKTELTKTTLQGAVAAGLDETAYLFIPADCALKGAACKTHLVLHGCAQSTSQIDSVFIEQSGYLEWAESNNIVLAFPQVVPAAANPFACWDWWGYTGSSYRWRDGLQMTVLANWVQELTSH